MEKVKIFTGTTEDTSRIEKEINEFLGDKKFISLTPIQSMGNKLTVLTFTLIYKEKPPRGNIKNKPKGL